MKKLLLILVVSIMLVGCGKTINFDLKTVESNLSNFTINNEKEFKDCINWDKDTLEMKYEIDTTNMEEILVMMPSLVNSANMYMVVKAKSGKVNEVKKELDKIMKSYENAWGMGYAPEEADKVNNRLEKTEGNYLIYIISSDNENVLKEIHK